MEFKSFNLGIFALFFKRNPLSSSRITNGEVQRQLSGVQPVAIARCKMVIMSPKIYEAFASWNKWNDQKSDPAALSR